ncbi:MAG TPA: DUF1223 domain-containing protein [Ramlibacter sp.]|uniref:DUF1223 domain-containing protein n=1 Tax=Ramlibacter sp. TaxID=1917967 RepID=UPI002C61DF74|nr:DUF1223 domain-containing protein [Ramlibacter sp.]HVZ43618.1 DUF1223 domain-containing protein [Ramlibacter sp.]
MTRFLQSLAVGLAAATAAASSAAAACAAQSGASITPVIELYTSEGCSSCPPADKWLSTLKPAVAQRRVVAEAFHVGYWDYIGWVDRFAAPAYTARQRQLASANGLASIYTPQLVRNGRDWRDFSSALGGVAEPARASVRIERTGNDAFEAAVSPLGGASPWAAYWTVTENGHASKVKAGENAGEFLQHDFVVRQYVPAGKYEGAQRLKLNAVAAEAGHARQVNLVVFDPRGGTTLQAVSLACSG